jgi:PAS domain S-box-containing protein
MDDKKYSPRMADQEGAAPGASELDFTQNEERLRLATELAEVGFWDVDTVNDVLIWPPIVKAMFGISADAPVSMADFYTGLHPDDRDRTSEAFAAATDPGRRALYDVEYRTIGKEDGIIRWVAAKGRGVFDESGSCVRVLGTAVDVTARRLTEAALGESEARVRALTDNLPAGMVYQIRTSPDGSERRFLYVSQSHEALTGIPAAAVLADPTIPYNLILPEDRERLVAAEVEAIRTKNPFDVEARFRRADGEERWCRILSAPREQTNGSIIWDGIQIDTTDQKNAEAALRELNETLEQRVNDALAERKLLADVFDATGAFIQVVDPTYNLLAINRANADEYECRYGIRPMRGDNLLTVLADHPEQLERARAHFARALQGETFTITGEFGEEMRGSRWYEIKFSPLRGHGGKLIGAYHFSMDVTERREEQERLKEAEEALRQAQKMEAMGQLTGGVAHDFNNLLTPIVGSLDLLQRRGVGDERERRMIAGALASAERARVLVQRLLAFARRQPLQPTAVDARQVVEGMAELIASSTGPQIKVVVETAPDIPPALADQNQLEMALLNLSVNARDAMPEGGILRISADEEHVTRQHRAKLKPGRYVRLSVADTGTGMDEATLRRAVEPFFSTKGIGKGTGLGLSMVHGLAAQLGGALSVSSSIGLGTNIELFLPAAQVQPSTSPSKGVTESAAATGTILLVDDEELVRASTADMLADLGYCVIEATSAEEALRRINSGLEPDILVTDHLMPGMNGTELARELRDRMPGTRVLIVSGYADVEGIAPDLPRLVKPFRRAELAASLAGLDGRMMIGE